MSERYQILTTIGHDITSVKNFKLLSEAKEHYLKLKELHKNDDGFREYDNGQGFISNKISCEFQDTEYELNSVPTGFSGIGLADINPLVYLASPYTGNEEENFQKVAKKASELMAQGMTIFSPISMCHPMSIYGKLPGNWEFWEKFDRDYLSVCNKIIVYRLPGWEKSKGVQAEIKIAQELGIPVEYID